MCKRGSTRCQKVHNMNKDSVDPVDDWLLQKEWDLPHISPWLVQKRGSIPTGVTEIYNGTAQ